MSPLFSFRFRRAAPPLYSRSTPVVSCRLLIRRSPAACATLPRRLTSASTAHPPVSAACAAHHLLTCAGRCPPPAALSRRRRAPRPSYPDSRCLLMRCPLPTTRLAWSRDENFCCHPSPMDGDG